MHVEIVAPALLASPGESRLPALEMLLARGRRTHDDRRTRNQWLANAFGLDAGPLPTGALTRLAGGGDPGKELWLRADPVHLRLQRDTLALIPSAGFPLGMDEANAIIDSLNRHFEATFSIHASLPEHWSLRLNDDRGLEAGSPLELAGKDVNANLPGGPHAAHWHATLNEVQMLLHDHPVNERREIPVNSLWFWGAGQLPDEAAGPWQSVTADDPVALGLARLAKIRHRTLPAGAKAWLERMPEDGRHLVLVDGLDTALALRDDEAYAARLASLEADWFAPLLVALRDGAIGMVTLHAPDAGLSVETERGDLRRFWRRPRPLATYATGHA